jgi:phosphate starvation-inducible PhoH-like protein
MTARKRTQKLPPKTLPRLDIDLNEEQKAGYEVIQSNTVTYINGYAGSGKTLLALYAALDALHGNQVNTIFVTRPYITAKEDIGFLPGDLSEKYDPFMVPIMDNLHKLYPDRHRSNGKSKIEQYIEDGDVEIAPLGFMRGRTMTDSYLILDEAQNITAEQLKMAMTRIGLGSKMIICGDLKQCDLKRPHESGIWLLQEVINRGVVKGIGSVYLKENHRDSIVQQLLDEFETIEAMKGVIN